MAIIWRMVESAGFAVALDERTEEEEKAVETGI